MAEPHDPEAVVYAVVRTATGEHHMAEARRMLLVANIVEADAAGPDEDSHHA